MWVYFHIFFWGPKGPFFMPINKNKNGYIIVIKSNWK
jgi:hypothetical protein